MNAKQMERAATFLAGLNTLSENTRIHIEDTGGHEKHLTLVEDSHSLFGSNGQLRWVDDHYEIETY